MSDFFVAPIVEGHGEVQALPILLQRILQEVRSDAVLRVNPALRVKPGSFFNDTAYFKKYVELASRKAKANPVGSVLILLDCEDCCPAELGRTLYARAAEVRGDICFIVALAYREYETWFLNAARSLRGVEGLPLNLEPPAAPESIRDAKGWISRHLGGGYNEPILQPALTRRFDLHEASANPSFARLREKLGDLFACRGDTASS